MMGCDTFAVKVLSSYFVMEQLEMYEKRKCLPSGRTQDLISELTFQLLQKPREES